jgi:spore coat protein U-like protein
MTVASRIISRLAALVLLGLVPAGHAHAAQTTIKASAKVVKSLTLIRKQDLDFGTIMLSGAPGTFTVSISMTGVLTCPGGFTCSGTPRPAILNVTGSNGNVVRITALPSDLVNATDGSKLRFTPIAPATIALTNSGNPGKDFNVGGSIDIPSTAADGVYSGNIEVTIDYQ